MKIKQIVLMSATLALLHAPAFAEKKEAGSGPNPFSDCGIGAALFDETKWAAVTSNVIWDVGTTAVTSATASPETCNGKKIKAAAFINDTYEKLAEDTARGEGEHLTSLMNILECGGAGRAVAIQATREGMADVVAQPGYVNAARKDKAIQFYNVVNSAVQKSCSV